MKRVLALLLCFAMVLGLVPAAMALGSTIIIDAGSADYKETGVWYGSQSLFSYDDSPTRYATEADATATWTPNISIPGKYEVFVWKVAHTTNSPSAKLEINSADGITEVEFDMSGTESDFVSVGTYQFEAGTEQFVRMTSTVAGFTRTGSVKFELVEQTGEAVLPDYNVPLDDPDYPQNGTRTLQSKDVSVPEGKAGAQNIFVQPGANGDGSSAESPLGSLEEAQSKVREMIAAGYPAEGIVVQMMGGIYSLSDSLTFTEEDSGTEESPVIWKAYNDETVTVTAGTGLNASDFVTVTDESILNRLPEEARGNVLEIDLTKAGIESVAETDFVNNAPYQLIVGDEAQVTAKWPNVGYGRTGTVKDAASRMDSGPRKKGFTYDLNEARSIRWETATDAWLSGFWLMEYTMDFSKVTDVDSEMMTISGKHPTVWGSGGDARYYICNLLEEIDQPSEFFLDTQALKLYYYPIEGWESKNLIVATTNVPILRFESSSNVIFRDAIIEGAGSNGVEFAAESSNNLVAGGAIRNVSKVGATISGHNNGVRDCDIYYTGSNGVNISGGNPKTTEAASNYLENCSVHDVGLNSTSKVGITFSGVGHRMSNNHLYNIPHQGITGGTFMDCIIENNIIERTNYELDDTAAIYINFACFGYGTKIRNNLITDAVGIMEGEGGSTGGMVHGIYLDSGTSGVEISGNVIANTNLGFFNNFGRDIVVKDNIMINTQNPIQFSIWGNREGKGFVEGGELDTNIKAYYTDAFKAKFPEAHTATTMSDNPNYPKYNTVLDNISVGSTINIIGAAIEGGQEANNQTIESVDGITDLLYDYNQVRTKLGKSGDQIVGNYVGGLRTNTTAPIVSNRVDAFYLEYPANQMTNLDPNDITLSWANERGGIISNTVYISENPEMTEVVAVENTVHPTLTLNLEYGKTYYWRVKAMPKYDYEERWNSGGVYQFSTISAEDKIDSLITLGNEMLANMERDQQQKDALTQAIQNAQAALASSDQREKTTAIQELEEQTEEYTSNIIVDTSNMTTLIYDDFTLDTEGERPLGLFLRSYSPLNVNAANLNGNMAVKFDDQQSSTMYGHRVFQNQNAYVEVSANVMKESQTGSFAIGLKETDRDIVATGVNTFCAAKVIFGNDGMIYGDKNMTVQLMPYEVGQWYRVKMCVDFTKGTYDVYVNGELKGQDIAITDNVKSTNQLMIDSSDGTSQGAAHTGVFYIDDVIVKAPTSTGRNSFLKEIRVNGQQVSGFAADSYIYETELSAQELADAEITYTAPQTAHVYQSEADGKVFLTVFSGDYQRSNVYTIKAK